MQACSFGELLQGEVLLLPQFVDRSANCARMEERGTSSSFVCDHYQSTHYECDNALGRSSAQHREDYSFRIRRPGPFAARIS
jgi:hypothetical protein